MKKAFSFVITIAMFCSLFNCKTKDRLFDPNDTTKLYISFGSGGGFTGKSIKYFLDQNGNIYKEENSSFTKFKSISKNEAKQFYNNYKMLELNNINLNEPGNKYYFLESNIAGNTHVIKWGRNPLENKNLETFYDIIMAIVNQTII